VAVEKDIIHTKSILSSIKEYSSEQGYPLAKLDFTVMGVQTYFKTCNFEAFIKFHEGYKEEYSSKAKLIKDHTRFLQIYKIKVHPKTKKKIHLVYRIEKGEFSTYPIMVISPESRLPIDDISAQDMLKLLYTEINKIKAKNKIMVNLFSNCMVKDLKKFVHDTYTNGFTEEKSILLFEGIDPEIAEPSKVINHYLDKTEKLDNKNVPEVEESELIITYVKPIYGKAGLNAYGQRIEHGDTNSIAKIEYQIDAETIDVQEDDLEIKYYSKKRGFVSTLKNKLTISNKIVLETFKRSQGRLTKKEENEVSVVISQTDVTRDGLGEGAELISESVHITGHMGAKSRVEGKDVVIDGATHNDAFVTARTAKINRHKGTLRCHKAEINSLEGGTIYATHVTINAALGGQVCAEHVTVKSVKHNLKVFASKSITIERILGEDNHFVIDYRKLPTAQSKLQFLNEEYEVLQEKLENAKKHSPENTPGLQDELEKKEEEINAIKFCHYDAVITVMAPINGLNIIEFVVPELKQSLIYRTVDAKTFEPFTIHKSGDKIVLEPVGVELYLPE
jgi:hypothetical protein